MFLRPGVSLVFCLIGFAVASVAIAGDGPTRGNATSVPSSKPRLLVLTDIGGDPDDQQSMIRLMHYANEFDVEGLIASASGTPGELKQATTKPELIRAIVTAYGEVRSNLARHADGYPSAEDLLARIRSGNPQRGWDAVGAGHDTEGSRWIVERIDADDPRPLNIVVWGGQTDLAQALWRVRAARGAEGLARFVDRFRVYDINDQDGIFERMRKEFPGLNYVLAQAPEGVDKRDGAYRGMYLGGDESLTSRAWVDSHVRLGHGPLGALYPTKTWTAPNPHSTMKEGDTPSWFFFLPTGLGDPNHPDWGGFGGRFAKNDEGVWRDAIDTVPAPPDAREKGNVTSARATVWRWREAFQNDFAARLDWAVAESFDQANHPPVAVLNGDASLDAVRIDATPGETIRLTAEGSTDPDGDDLTYRWFVYPEAGTYRGDVALDTPNGPATSFVAPPVDGSRTIHVILEIRDDGEPELIRYRRAVVTVDGF